MELTRYMMAAAVSIILLMMVWPNAAHAQYRNAGPGAGAGVGEVGYGNGGGFAGENGGGWNGFDHGGYGYGYHAGVVVAQSDYQSNSAFAPYPSYCCHSWFYKQVFANFNSTQMVIYMSGTSSRVNIISNENGQEPWSLLLQLPDLLNGFFINIF
jgi:hypothetical protein